jgi:hypothetical protein
MVQEREYSLISANPEQNFKNIILILCPGSILIDFVTARLGSAYSIHIQIFPFPPDTLRTGKKNFNIIL